MKTYEQTIARIAEQAEYVHILSWDTSTDELYKFWASEEDTLQGMHIMAAFIFDVSLATVISDVMKLRKGDK